MLKMEKATLFRLATLLTLATLVALSIVISKGRITGYSVGYVLVKKCSLQ